MHCLALVHRFFFLRTAYFLLVVVEIFPSLLAAMPMGSDRMPHFAWERVAIEHQLPAHPVSIGAATALGDFIAVAKNKKSDENEIYFLDHANLHHGWQKKGSLEHVTVCSIQYGLGRFFIFGIDTKNHHSVVASSVDSGTTWNQQEIPSSVSHYDVAAFSSTQGLVTGREGAVAKTNDGITWTQIIAPSGSKKKIFSLQQSPSDQLGFVVVETSQKNVTVFFLSMIFHNRNHFFQRMASLGKKQNP